VSQVKIDTTVLAPVSFGRLSVGETAIAATSQPRLPLTGSTLDIEPLSLLYGKREIVTGETSLKSPRTLPSRCPLDRIRDQRTRRRWRDCASSIKDHCILFIVNPRE